MKTLLLCAITSLALLGCGGPQTPADAPGDDDDPAGAGQGDMSAAGADEPGAEGAGEAGGVPGETASGAGPAKPVKGKCKPTQPPKGETDNQRKRRLQREKLVECQDVGEAIQKAELVTTIASVNDKEKLAEISGKLIKAADELDRLGVCVKGLEELRDDYSSRARKMAKLLRTAAETTEIDEQRGAIAEFRKLQPLQGEFINKINEFCNAPVE